LLLAAAVLTEALVIPALTTQLWTAVFLTLRLETEQILLVAVQVVAELQMVAVKEELVLLETVVTLMVLRLKHLETVE
jgi:hypothetical protein